MESEFHAHPDRCHRCRKGPFDLCPIGVVALRRSALRETEEERQEIEKRAASRAYAAGLGASEWEAFLTPEERRALFPVPEQPKPAHENAALRQRVEELERRAANAQAQVAYMCQEIATALSIPLDTPAGTLQSVRSLYLIAERKHAVLSRPPGSAPPGRK